MQIIEDNMQKKFVERKLEKSRIIIYCLEGSIAIIGIVMFVLALLKIGFANIPMGSRISSALMAILLAFLPMILEKVFRYRFPLMLHIIYVSYIFASTVVGSCFGVFRMDIPIMGEMLGWYDKLAHAVLGYILCVVAIYLSQKAKVWGKSIFGDILLIVAISMAYASIWEMFEFAVDHIIPGQSMQRNSLIDTMLDIIAHFATTMLFVIQYVIEKCAKVNLGIAFIEKNLQSGGRVAKKNQVVEVADTLQQEQEEIEKED